jgi:hypothetical protein
VGWYSAAHIANFAIVLPLTLSYRILGPALVAKEKIIRGAKDSVGCHIYSGSINASLIWLEGID